MSVAPGAAATLTPAERDYIRRELDMFFSSYPTVAEGFQLKTWRGGPQAGQPKLSPSAKTLLETRTDEARRHHSHPPPVLPPPRGWMRCE